MKGKVNLVKKTLEERWTKKGDDFGVEVDAKESGCHDSPNHRTNTR